MTDGHDEELADAPWCAPPDARWWPAVAARVLELAGAAAPAAPPGRCDLHGIVVLLPSLAHAPALHAALHRALAGRACIAPRLLTLEAWAQVDAQRELRQRAELFQALRASEWVRQRFGDQAGALWALARDLALLGDELTLAACGEVEAFAGRWRSAVQRHFSRRAAQAADPQAQLVLALWRAGLDGEAGAAGLRRRLDALARSAEGPLLWLAPQGALPWQRNFCQAYRLASGHAARLIVGDFAALAAAHPWIGAAWPELAVAAPPLDAAAAGAPQTDALADALAAPLAQRARALAEVLRAGAPGAPALASPLRIFRCDTLEEEALAAAHWTMERLRGGAGSIALVALDRLTARRVRALLERAGVLVADEAGWKLSTTSAAAAVMRWLDLVAGDFVARELLDWMHSPFTLRDRSAKPTLLAAIRDALVEDGIVGGRQALLQALTRRTHDSGASLDALALVQELAAAAEPWRRPATLGRYLGLLEASLDRLGMRPALLEDAVGRSVLQALEALHAELVGSPLALTLDEFRALLAGHFEQTATAQPGAGASAIDSPVRMTTLAGTRLRRFDAALLIGADADRLPGVRPAGGLLAHAVRRELGLRCDLDREREQAQDLAGLLAGVSTVDATWRCRHQDEPRPLSPLLDRLVMLAELAGAPAPLRAAPTVASTVMARVSPERAPRAPELLPARVSASAYQDLVDCPYRFFALRMLGLREARRLGEMPDKRDFGALLHEVLHRFHQLAPADEDEAAARLRLGQTIDAACAPRLRQQPALLGYRQRLHSLVPGYVAWQAQAQREGWRWVDGERALQQPLRAAGLAGAVALHGRLDRIDAQASGRRRVLDYKARDGASLRRGQRDPGEDVQLLFYVLLLEPPPAEAAYLSLQRPPDPRHAEAGVAQLVAAPQPLAEQAESLRATLAASLERIAQGALLPANGVEAVCRRCELRSLCRHGFTAAAQAPAGLRGDADE